MGETVGGGLVPTEQPGARGKTRMKASVAPRPSTRRLAVDVFSNDAISSDTGGITPPVERRGEPPQKCVMGTTGVVRWNGPSSSRPIEMSDRSSSIGAPDSSGRLRFTYMYKLFLFFFDFLTQYY